MKKLIIFLAVMFCMVLAGCDAPAEPTGSAPADSSTATAVPTVPAMDKMGFTGEGGNPDVLDIWYYLEGEQPLSLPELGLSWPLDQPYQWESVNRQ